MSEYIIEIPDEYFASYDTERDMYYPDERDSAMPITPFVRCSDCKYGHKVNWPTDLDIPNDYLDCTGPLVTTWDYYHDEPQDNPVRPDGFCAWGERKSDERA